MTLNGLVWLSTGQLAATCEHVFEISRSVQYGEFLAYMNYQFLKGSDTCRWLYVYLSLVYEAVI